MLFSLRWTRLPFDSKHPLPPNWIRVETTFLDEQGKRVQKVREYEEWIGVCTNTIDKVLYNFKKDFPEHTVRYVRLGDSKKILPYFEERLARNKLDYRSKPFYKLYTTANHENVGRFVHQYKIGYYDKKDWLVRLYIDLCTKYDSRAFFYKWYDVSEHSSLLLQSFRMRPDIVTPCQWNIAAFDLEAVPMDGTSDRIPNGNDVTDTIVMISVFLWKNGHPGPPKKILLYLLPNGLTEPLESCPGDDVYAYTSETQMLRDFHTLVSLCTVLTGYNINGYDLPLVFARLVWLEQGRHLGQYSSQKIGQHLVTTFNDMLVIDVIDYVKTFSKYDLPGYKLDDVARIKLGESKIPVKSTGLTAWYTNPVVTPELLRCDDIELCYDLLKPNKLSVKEFGTFRTYLNYCLKDSELVYRIFEKEMILSFLIERANFTAMDAMHALYLGNSSYLLDLFKTYGTRLGFFFNEHFFKTPINSKKFESTFVKKGRLSKYQGALNFSHSETFYEDVSVMDFTSMYPNTIANKNICFGTCTILRIEEWLRLPEKVRARLTAIPYRVHSEADFRYDTFGSTDHFSFPEVDPSRDKFVMVFYIHTQAFLPCVVLALLALRKYHQEQWQITKDVYHYNVQMCIKILVNSLYGVMGAGKDSPFYSPLSCLVIAMAVTCLSRYQLLGVYHFLMRLGYFVSNCDTDSVFLTGWNYDDCELVNAYLKLKHVELKYEKRLKRLLILTKKRYVYESQEGRMKKKSFPIRVNDLVKEMCDSILGLTWKRVFDIGPHVEDGVSAFSRGWIIFVETLTRAQYECRDAKKYSITRKTKSLADYKSKTCPSVRILERYPEKENSYIDFVYSRADVSEKEASKWVMDAEDCEITNFEQLFISHRKIFCRLLNMGYWNLNNPTVVSNRVLNGMRWKCFVLAELRHWWANDKEKIIMLVEPKEKYTFRINDHFKRKKGVLVRDDTDGPKKKKPKKQKKVDDGVEKGKKSVKRKCPREDKPIPGHDDDDQDRSKRMKKITDYFLGI